jgi:hypothetical protein
VSKQVNSSRADDEDAALIDRIELDAANDGLGTSQLPLPWSQLLIAIAMIIVDMATADSGDDTAKAARQADCAAAGLMAGDSNKGSYAFGLIRGRVLDSGLRTCVAIRSYSHEIFWKTSSSMGF